jgi:hypothetical protein
LPTPALKKHWEAVKAKFPKTITDKITPLIGTGKAYGLRFNNELALKDFRGYMKDNNIKIEFHDIKNNTTHPINFKPAHDIEDRKLGKAISVPYGIIVPLVQKSAKWNPTFVVECRPAKGIIQVCSDEEVWCLCRRRADGTFEGDADTLEHFGIDPKVLDQ